MTELLLVLSPGQPPPARATQRVSPRVVIVAIDDCASIEELRAGSALAVLEPGDALPPHVRETLTESERMFADAFAIRARAKTRRGEGLDWDAEGFLPPDPPPKR